MRFAEKKRGTKIKKNIKILGGCVLWFTFY